MEAQADPGNIITFLMQQGIGEATDVLLIDESLCVRCDNCEKACADTHDGTSRLDREAGPTFAQLHVPTSCRHCEHPHCMKDCPPDAIHRAPNGEVFIERHLHRLRQLRAQLPLRRDPDGARRPEAARARASWSWLLLGLGDGARAWKPRSYDKTIAEEGGQVRHVQGPPGGAACVRACPTGAAIRVSPEKFLDYTNAVAP